MKISGHAFLNNIEPAGREKCIKSKEGETLLVFFEFEEGGGRENKENK